METRSSKKRRKASGGGDNDNDNPQFLGSLLDMEIPTPPELKNTSLRVQEPKAKRSRESKSRKSDGNSNPGPKRTKTTAKNKKGGRKRPKGKFQLAYTNRRAAKELSRNNELSSAKEDLATLTEEEKLMLNNWGLPNSVVEKYKSKGVMSLFPWQLECLGNEKVLDGRNLLYSAPTSAGKTLVAEVLMLKRVLELGRKAIMILPFVSVCREKMYSLQELFGDAGVRVEGFMGSYAPPGGFKAVDIAICTIEKANSLINRLLEENSLSQLGTIVVDELHLIGDAHRGYLLELLLTKIRFMVQYSQKRYDDSLPDGQAEGLAVNKLNIQIIGMSATLPNLKMLSSWLDAELVISEYRPVPLVERICFNEKIYDPLIQPVRDVYQSSLSLRFRGDENYLVYLSLETVLAGHSVLIFCPTKAKCESVAERIAREFFNVGNSSESSSSEIAAVANKLRAQLNANDIRQVLTQLQNCPGGLEEVLKRTVAFGVAFHHAGLTYDERDIIEASFKRSVLRVIVATSTLSAGVNLPARRVIISSPMAVGGVLDSMTYRQMCGRAGRKGVDTEGLSVPSTNITFFTTPEQCACIGESILVCTNTNKEAGISLVQSSLPYVRSALLGDEGALTSSMKRALLEVIASGIANRPADVEEYAKCTLLSKSIDAGLHEDSNSELPASQHSKNETIKACLCFLEENEFIRLQKYETTDKPDEYMPTQLGSACLAASMAPDEGINVYKELQKARKCFVLESELHVVYQVTPLYLSDQIRNIPWLDFLSIWNDLGQEDKTVSSLVGVEEAFIMRAMIGSVSSKNPKQKQKFLVHQRFFAALALNDLVSEVPLTDVARKYSLSKGVIQNLQQSASTFAGMVTAFCGRLGWSNLELLLGQFQERLQFGVQRELCDLVRLSTMNGQRARILYNTGIKTVADLAASDSATVETVLHRAAPFHSAVHSEQNSPRHIWMIGLGEGLSEREAAQKIVDEARQFIQMELGFQGDIDFEQMKRPVQDDSKLDLLGPSEVSCIEEMEDEKRIVLERSPKIESSTSFMEDNFEHFLHQSLPNEKQEPQSPAADSKSMTGLIAFEDSFPEFSFEEKKELSTASEDVRLILNAIVEAAMDISDEGPDVLHNTPIEETCLSPKNFTTRDHIAHSTPGRKPLVSHNSLTRNRLSSIAFDDCIPISPMNGNKDNIVAAPAPNAAKASIKTSTPNNVNPVLNNDDEINAEVLVELNKDFDSVASMMETSLSISNIEEVENFVHKKDGHSHKLSESDVAALEAIANDSKFESEDMFPDLNTKQNNDERSLEVVASIEPSKESVSTSMDGGSTTGAETSTERETSTDFSAFETSSDYVSSGHNDSLSARGPDRAPTPLYTSKVPIHGHVLKVMKILTPEFIPELFFREATMITIGFRFNPPNKSASISKIGIGSRVIGKHPEGPSILQRSEGQASLSIYNGGSVIWVYQWKYICFGSCPDSMISPRSATNRIWKLFRKIQYFPGLVGVFDLKDNLKRVLKATDNILLMDFPQKSLDPKIAHWILRADDEDLYNSVKRVGNVYLSTEEKKIWTFGWDRDIEDAFIAWHTLDKMIPELKKRQLWDSLIQNEMPCVFPLLIMEMNGMGLDAVELEKLKRVLQFKSAVLEIKAFQLAGKQFNLSSSKEISKVLFKENGLTQPLGTKGTGKDVLVKIDHELPQVILEWRKVTNSLQRFVIPFQQEISLDTGRVHGHYSHFTVTGRVVMSDPSLQCIPRDFDLELDFSSKEVEDMEKNCKIKFGSKLAALVNQIETSKKLCSQSQYLRSSLISMRNAFIPCSHEFVILTADYSQLELRILAHLCQDQRLLEALNVANEDVFVSIASVWKKVRKDQVTSSMRQEAKGIVYGVIYGMGPKTLAEQMEINEIEAGHFITQFMRTYPSVKTFLDKAIKLCRINGFVETMSGRRRYLPNISSKNPAERATAERQAINSQIQGSAADLVKIAMSKTHSRLHQLFPKNMLPVNWPKHAKPKSARSIVLPKSLIYFPVLNLHDELMFEVRKTHLNQVAKEIREQMESCVKLSVRLPVVMKAGNSWGTLLPLEAEG